MNLLHRIESFLNGNIIENRKALAKLPHRSLRDGYARFTGCDGVRANAICPGGVNTGLAATYAIPAGIDPALVQRLYPLCDAAEPEEIAAAVAYIASPEARYVTGVSFGIDGGQLL